MIYNSKIMKYEQQSMGWGEWGILINNQPQADSAPPFGHSFSKRLKY